MASAHDTQTHPKFTWLFLATRPNDKAAPTILRTTAATEAEARAYFPGWNLAFAAKIRTESPINYCWGDRDSLWSICGTNTVYMAGVCNA